MPTSHPAIPIEHHPTLPSTQTRARELVDQAHPTPILITADQQTGGVGRTGRHWESPRGGLWMTLLWPLPEDHHRILESLGLRIGLACARSVARALEPHTGAPRVRLKWPNDILLETLAGARKAGGVLVEIKHHPPRSFALVGVGLNVNVSAADLTCSLRPLSDTLRAHTSRDIALDALRDDLTRELIDALGAAPLDATRLAELRAILWGVGQRVTLTLADGARAEGTLLGLADDGRLQLDRDGERWLAPLSAELAPPAP